VLTEKTTQVVLVQVKHIYSTKENLVKGKHDMDRYGAVQDGNITKLNLKPGCISPVTGKRLGINSPLSTYNANGLYLIAGDKPSHDSATQTISGPTHELDEANNQINRVWVTSDIPLDTLKATVLEKLNAISKQQETKGITLPTGDFARTDYTTQSRLTQAALQGQLDSSITYDWKGPDGLFTVLTVADVTAIAQAVNAHVQACFTRESVLTTAVNACATVEALVALDLTTGWPGV